MVEYYVIKVEDCPACLERVTEQQIKTNEIFLNPQICLSCGYHLETKEAIGKIETRVSLYEALATITVPVKGEQDIFTYLVPPLEKE